MSRYQKGKPIWILLKQETVSGSGISWAICKSAPRSRQITITTPAPYHSSFSQAGCPSCRPTNSVKALKAISRREEMPGKIFQDISEPTSCLRHLLTEPRERSITSRLRIHGKYHGLFTRTKPYCSFIQYAPNHCRNSTKKHNNVNRHSKQLELSFSAIAIFVNDSCYQEYILASIVIVYLTL